MILFLLQKIILLFTNEKTLNEEWLPIDCEKTTIYKKVP